MASTGAAGTPAVEHGLARPPGATTIFVMLALAVALYFGRDVLMPLALAVLLAFALAPIVKHLRRIGLPRGPGVVLVVLAGVLLAGGFGVLLASQLVDLTVNLPRYQSNLEAKIHGLQEMAPEGGLFDRIGTMAAELSRQLGGASVGDGGRSRPIVVTVADDAAGLDTALAVAGPLLSPLGLAVIVIAFVIFLLLEREDLRNRLIWLLGENDLTRATETLDDGAYRIGRYLLAQAVLNFGYGCLFGIGLWIIGVPNPVLWGILTAILRFVPVLGSIVAMAFPTILGFVADPGWVMPVATILLFLTLDIVATNVVEPLLYGGSTGLSPFAVVLAMVFWATIWGVAGLLLATPLTVCLVVLGRHLPQLSFLEVLLGSTPALAPATRFYQRILAGDPLEALETAEAYLAAEGRRALFMDVVLPAMRMAEEDRRRGALAGDRRQEVWRTFGYVVDELAEDDPDHASERDGAVPVLSIGARDEFDRAAAEMLRQLLVEAGVPAVRRDGAPAQLVFVSHAGEPSGHHTGRLIRRLRHRFGPGSRIALCFWARPGEPRSSAGEIYDTGTVLVTSVDEALAAAAAAAPAPAASAA
jgi:predicted PurR-regulated permease PerM